MRNVTMETKMTTATKSNILSTMLRLQAFTTRDLSLNAHVSEEEARAAVRSYSSHLLSDSAARRSDRQARPSAVYRIKAGSSVELAAQVGLDNPPASQGRRLSSPLALTTAEALCASYKGAGEQEQDEILRKINVQTKLARTEINQRRGESGDVYNELEKRLRRLQNWSSRQRRSRDSSAGVPQVRLNTPATSFPELKVFGRAESIHQRPLPRRMYHSTRQFRGAIVRAVNMVTSSQEFRDNALANPKVIVSTGNIPKEQIQRIITGSDANRRADVRSEHAHLAKHWVTKTYKTENSTVVVIVRRHDNQSFQNAERGRGVWGTFRLFLYKDGENLREVTQSNSPKSNSLKHRHAMKGSRRKTATQDS